MLFFFVCFFIISCRDLLIYLKEVHKLREFVKRSAKGLEKLFGVTDQLSWK